MDTSVETIKGLFDLGGVVVVTVMLWIVWRRLNDVTDKLIDILSELKAQRIERRAGAEVETQGILNPQK